MATKFQKCSLPILISYPLILFFFIAALSGCGEQTRHRTLAFFFTGVPPQKDVAEPDKKKGDPGNTALSKKLEKLPAPVPLFSHAPWVAFACSSCHETTASFDFPGIDKKALASRVFDKGGGMPGKLILPPEKICLTCHPDKTPERARRENLWLHNPVAKGDCLACHDPHQSKNKGILRKPAEQLCLSCHEKTKIEGITAHQKGGSCLLCHNPHLGKNKQLLARDYQETKPPAKQ